MFYVSKAVCDGGENDCGDGFGGDVSLCVVSVTVKMKSMLLNNVSKRKHVDDEKEGAKHRALGDSVGDGGSA